MAKPKDSPSFDELAEAIREQFTGLVTTVATFRELDGDVQFYIVPVGETQDPMLALRLGIPEGSGWSMRGTMLAPNFRQVN